MGWLFLRRGWGSRRWTRRPVRLSGAILYRSGRTARLVLFLVSTLIIGSPLARSVRREGDRLVVDGRADDCCVLTLEGVAVTRLFDALAEWL